MTRLGRPPVDDAVRFWPKVQKGDACWEWQGVRSANGYGAFRFGPSHSQIGAHRAAWLLTRGEVPAGLLVLHHCDNRGCVRPDHLFIGTASDNTKDAVAKGRWPQGGLRWRLDLHGRDEP